MPLILVPYTLGGLLVSGPPTFTPAYYLRQQRWWITSWRP
jgi:hypothetical protein